MDRRDISWEDDEYLSHHGILGMKWGVRRYQNEDGSYTNAGQQRHAVQQRNLYGDPNSNAARQNNRSRNIKRGVAIAAGVLATGAIAYGLYRTGAYKTGLNTAKRILGQAGNAAKNTSERALNGINRKKLAAKESAKRKLLEAGDKAKEEAKRRAYETVDSRDKSTAATLAIDRRIKKFKDKRQAAKQAREQARQEKVRIAAEKARAAARQKASKVSPKTKQTGKDWIKKHITSKFKRSSSKNKRSVDRFNKANTDFLNNMDDMMRRNGLQR